MYHFVIAQDIVFVIVNNMFTIIILTNNYTYVFDCYKLI